MRWATRRHVHVDRVACAWLIRRFIDAGAEFVFVDDLEDVPRDATPFDMVGAALSHADGGCSFETFLRRYGLADPALAAIAEIVHEADLGDERFDAPEGRGLDVIVHGLSMTTDDDDQVIERSGPIFDGLYAYEQRAVSTRRDPS